MTLRDSVVATRRGLTQLTSSAHSKSVASRGVFNTIIYILLIGSFGDETFEPTFERDGGARPEDAIGNGVSGAISGFLATYVLATTECFVLCSIRYAIPDEGSLLVDRKIACRS
jgi:hypothetical protein